MTSLLKQILFQDKQEVRTLYECPVYKTRQRGIILFLFQSKPIGYPYPSCGQEPNHKEMDTGGDPNGG